MQNSGTHTQPRQTVANHILGAAQRALHKSHKTQRCPNLSFADFNADPHVALADLNVDPHVADGPPDILTQVTFWVGRVVLIDGVAPL